MAIAAVEREMTGWGAGVHAEGDWFVLHTRSRQEKALAADLDALAVPYFLPLIRTVRYYGRRKMTVELPLFPSYVFLRGSIEQAYQADRTRRLARLIAVPDQTRLDSELRHLEQALAQGVELDPHPYLREGMRVEVRSGPLKGLQGVIEKRARRARLILQVQVLGRASSLEIDGSLLEPIVCDRD